MSERLQQLCPFFWVSVVGIVHDLEDVQPTDSGDLRRTFKLAGDNGFWLYRCAHGTHVESNALGNTRHICICFGTGRSQVGSLPQGLWVFPGCFCMPLGRKLVSLLLRCVHWKGKSVSPG